MKLISNTSPLILLFEADLEFVLRELYGEIIIPEEVLSEILISPKVDKLSNQIESCDWIRHAALLTTSFYDSCDYCDFVLGRFYFAVFFFIDFSIPQLYEE